MEHEAEAAGLASVGGLDSGTHHPVESGIPCKNCGTVVEVRFCTNCGQLGADFHRPLFDLITSSIGDMFTLDGRLLRSLPMLMLRPGRMTREYIDGQRARFVPPFRLFLLTSVIFFLTVFTVLEQQPWLNELKLQPGAQPSGSFVIAGDLRFNIEAADTVETLQARLADPELSDADRVQAEAALKMLEDADSAVSSFVLPDGTIDREALHQSIIKSNPDLTPAELATADAAAERFANFYENQDRFGARMKEWAPRFTLLFLPIFSALLALSYAWHRRRFFYDHLITGLHLQTFVYVLTTLLILLSILVPAFGPAAAAIGLLAVLVYLIRMLRVTYDTGYIMSFLRAGFLLTAATVALSLLAIGLVTLSFFLT
jgi:hypothetical protein